LQSVTTSRKTAAIGCVAQSMIDIIEGVQGSHYQQPGEICAYQNVTEAGDSFGLLSKGYLVGAAEHAALAISQPDATSAMHQHAELMDIALSNITGRVTTIEQDALHLRTNPTDLAQIQEIVTLADDAYHGVDVNGDGRLTRSQEKLEPSPRISKAVDGNIITHSWCITREGESYSLALCSGS